MLEANIISLLLRYNYLKTVVTSYFVDFHYPPQPYILYKFVHMKIVDVHAHNALGCDALRACKSAIFKRLSCISHAFQKVWNGRFCRISTFWRQYVCTFTQVTFELRTFNCNDIAVLMLFLICKVSILVPLMSREWRPVPVKVPLQLPIFLKAHSHWAW